jgi:alanine racemase
VKSWVEISEQRLTSNYKVLAKAAGGDIAVLAVLKANAYGHGAAVCAPVLARAGAEWMGVSDVAEGCVVRKALAEKAITLEKQPKILMMSGLLYEDADAVIQRKLTPVVWTRQQMEWLAESAARLGSEEPLPIHLEIDTGMARQGVSPGDNLDELLRWLKEQPRLRLDGVMTHFASAEVAGSRQTTAQRGLFDKAIERVVAAGIRPRWVHAGNSSTIDNQQEDHLPWLRKLAAKAGARPMIRSGMALYGYSLPIIRAGLARVMPRIGLDILPVMTWKTRILGVREVQAGDTVGYNAMFSATRPMRLALLPIGYADGLRRELSGADGKPGGWMMVHDRMSSIVGRISMNLTVIDITGSTAGVGDEVVVLGDGTTADYHARQAETIPYDIVCGVRAPSHLV